MLAAVAGIDLAKARLTAVPIEADHLEHTAEHDLVRPAPIAVLRWWTQRRSRLINGQRNLGGRPANRDAILDALVEGPMRRRPPLLRELQLLEPQNLRIRMQLRAPTTRQKAELTALKTL